MYACISRLTSGSSNGEDNNVEEGAPTARIGQKDGRRV